MRRNTLHAALWVAFGLVWLSFAAEAQQAKLHRLGFLANHSSSRPESSPETGGSRALDNLFQACAAETACNAAHPHLEKTFTELVNKFEAEPFNYCFGG